MLGSVIMGELIWLARYLCLIRWHPYACVNKCYFYQARGPEDPFFRPCPALIAAVGVALGETRACRARGDPNIDFGDCQ